MADVTPFPFATVEELKQRWPDFPTGGEAAATVALEDASQFILDVCSGAANASASTRRRVVCSVVRRAMGTPDGGEGMESMTQGAGPFQQTWKISNPDGNYYLNKQEKIALGCGKSKAFGVQIAFRPEGRHLPWCSLNFGAMYCSCGTDIAGEPIYEGGTP
ncbi:hypothetical protein [Arthrobacter woluwensis]|uniref:Uncharacterized protein n=2 Tax=Arthrobacter woluwensis TaxID=156980 RepID=A0A1H4WER6_9MICC|nr:hypothetical protein [Arthrobacter woluwensis]SEC54854.1 hypothetical protein SAMN04489745_3149 [Arthrobacter woluwensis]SEC91054.1 hypothetical protein SAMN04489745_3490 [Arthrobacter woluwensis]SEC93693.1 hypothetical protein SAMN04489745_3511 [Arthrobacter woluwensis]SEC96914.1 hypothetical protein SAMN04489745_3582 [Arthrobacter woluwensis]